MSVHSSNLAPLISPLSPEAIAAAGDLLGAELIQDIEVNRDCLAKLEGPDSIPQIDHSYESFVPDTGFDELVEASHGYVRETHAISIPRQRGKRPISKHIDSNIRDRLVTASRNASPSLVLLFEVGMEKCKQDLAAASNLLSQLAADVSQLPASTPLAEVPAEQRAVYVEKLVQLAGQSGRAGTLLPYRHSLGDLAAVHESEINSLLNEVAGTGQLPTRLTRQFATEIGRLERSAPILKISGKNIVARTVSQVYAQRPDLQQNNRSPEELIRAHSDLMELRAQTEQQRLVGDHCYKTIVGLREEWRERLTSALTEQIAASMVQISAGEELLSETPSGLERSELEAQLTHARAYIESLCAQLNITENDTQVFAAGQPAKEASDESAAIDPAKKPDLVDDSSARTQDTEVEQPEVVHPALAYALRTARQIFKGGGKLTADKAMTTTAKQLYSLWTETKGGERKKVLEPHECGMIMAVLTDHDRCFLELHNSVSAQPRGQLAPDLMGARREWASEIAMLMSLDVGQTLGRIYEVLSDPQLRQKLMGVLSQQEIEKLRNFVAPQQSVPARTVGSMAMSSASR